MLLITQPRVGISHNEIIALQIAARNAGWDVYSAETGWRLPEDMVKSGVLGVPYGSQTFCEVISMQMNWRLKQNHFDWLAKIPYEFTKRQVDFMTIKEARQLNQRKFIKPADDKCFAAAMYNPGTFVPHESIADNYPVLVSDEVQFDIEYRTFTNGLSVKTWSNYLFYGEINDPRYHHMVNRDHEHPVDFVNRLLQKLSHDNVALVPSVIDVGLIRGKGMAIIETNQVMMSGLYGCDPGGVIQALQYSCEY